MLEKTINSYEDEISFREIYIVIKNAIWWILLISILVATVAFFYFYRKPPLYETQSTTVITPSSIDIQSDVGVSFVPQTNVAFEAYETLAFSRPVLESVLDEVRRETSSNELTLNDLQSSLSLTKLFGASAGQPESATRIALSVDHNVVQTDPTKAALIANSWADHTLSTVKRTLLNSLSSVGDINKDQIAERKAGLNFAEQTLKEFESQNNFNLVESRFTTLSNAITQKEIRLDELSSRIPILETQIIALSEQLELEKLKISSSDPTSDTFLAGLSLIEAEEFLTEQNSKLNLEFKFHQEELNKFNLENNLTILKSKIETYQNQIATLPFDIQKITNDIQNLQNQGELLAQQLLKEENKVTTSNALSDVFLAGLSLEDAKSFLINQFNLSEQEYIEIQEQAKQFNSQNNLELIKSQILEKQNALQTIPIKILDIEFELSKLESRQTELRSLIDDEALKTQSSDSTSDSFLTGLNLIEASTIVNQQLAHLNNVREQAMLQLEDFDRGNNLVLLQAEVNRLNQVFASKKARLSELPSAIETALRKEQLLKEQFNQLNLTIELQDNLNANPLLSQLTSQSDDLGKLLSQASLTTSEVNPVFIDFQTSLLNTQVNNQMLLNERELLRSQIKGINEELETKRQLLISLQNQRRDLETQFSQIDTDYIEVLNRSEKLNYANQDAHGSLRILSGGYSSAYISLDAELRNLSLEVGTLNISRENLKSRLIDAQENLPLLVEQDAFLSAEYERISHRLASKLAEMNAVQLRVDDFTINSLDPRPNRKLRDTTPEVLSLQALVRENEQILRQFENQKSAAELQLDEANIALPVLRQRLIELSSKEKELTQVFESVSNQLLVSNRKLDQLRLADLDVRVGRSLNYSSSEVLTLQSRIREIAVIQNTNQVERDFLLKQLEEDSVKLKSLQQERAQMRFQGDQLRLDVDNMRAAHQSVIRLEPTISYMASLLPASAQILSAASIPNRPSGQVWPLATLAAFITTLVLMTIIAFLRSAVIGFST